MISYNRATATTVCQKIYDRLTVNIEQICEKQNSSKKTFFDLYEQESGYKVWFDRKNLTHGSIIDAMGEAIDNAYVVLVCMNEGYSNSRYCPKGKPLIVADFNKLLSELPFQKRNMQRKAMFHSFHV